MHKWIDSIQRSIKDVRFSKKPKDGSKREKKPKNLKQTPTSDDALQFAAIESKPLETVKRLRGPAGRRLPQRHTTNTVSKALSNSTSILEERDPNESSNSEGRSDGSDLSPLRRVSRSMSSIGICLNGASASCGDLQTHDLGSELVDLRLMSPDSVASKQVPSNRMSDSAAMSRPVGDNPVPVQRRNTLRPSEMQSPLTQELNKRLTTPNNRVSLSIRERMDDPTTQLAVTTAVASNISVRRDSFLEDLASSIAQVEGELRSVKKDIGGLQGLLIEKHRCDVIQEQLETSLSCVSDCQQKFALVISEAEQARDELKALVSHCKQLLISMEQDIDMKKSTQAIFI